MLKYSASTLEVTLTLSAAQPHILPSLAASKLKTALTITGGGEKIKKINLNKSEQD